MNTERGGGQLSDFTERLVAADPVAASPYSRSDLAEMTSRITAQPRPRTNQVLRTFQLRMASAVAVAGVVTVGAIAALQSAGPNLSVLAIGTTSKAVFAASAPATAMRVNTGFHFVTGPAIATGAGAAPALRLNVPNNAVAEVTRIAKAFSVSGSPTRRIGDVGTWDIRDASGVVVSYQGALVPPQWTYSNGSSAPVLSPNASSVPSGVVTTPARSTFVLAASKYLARLRAHYDLGQPTVALTSDPNLPVTAQPPLDRQVITYPVRIDGVSTDQSFVFMFDTTGKLLWVAGPDFGVANATDYPLVSAAEAVTSLNSQLNLATTQDSSQSNQTNITLMSEVMSLRTFQLTSGADWMLPTYVFSQIVGGPSTKWWIVAIEPKFLRADPATLSGMLTNGPINH